MKYNFDTLANSADETSANLVDVAGEAASTRLATVSVATNDDSVTVANVVDNQTPSILQNHCRGYLPHIENKRFQTITFRLCDSVPHSVIEQWKNELSEEERLNPNNEKANKLRDLIKQYEDACHGACYLRDERVATIMQNALLFYNNKRYKLVAWCIMPNHVHVLVEMMPGVSLSTVLHGWRSYTAHEANKILNRKGKFWMEEYFDRYIRDWTHFQYAYNYIINNPVKAGLVENAEEWKFTGVMK